MKREQWKSTLGFMWAAAGSAVGLGSIWRFPYIVGQNGGGAFVLLFCFFLIFISLPVLIAEIVIGRKTAISPHGAFEELGKTKTWGGIGLLTIITGFIVSSFYSVICGWTLGYLIEAILGGLGHFHTIQESSAHFQSLMHSPYWTVGTHFGFMFLAAFILYVGVQKGIEAWNEVLMPLLFVLLVLLVIKGLTMPGASKALSFLFTPDWKSVTPSTIIMALGQAFFGLSIGQGTMVTYGSYLTKKQNIPRTCFPIAIFVTIVSLLAGIAIFSVVFSVGALPSDGVHLMFETLPMVFSELPGGYFLMIFFLLLIFLAGLTSQISAMEPLIAYFMDEKKWPRHKSVISTGVGAFVLGVPSALAFGMWSDVKVLGMNFFEAISSLSINVLIPIGGLAAVILVGWRWGIPHAFAHLKEGTGAIWARYTIIQSYLKWSIRYFAPIVIVIILLNILGVI